MPASALREVGLVLAAAALVGLCAQITIPLPFTPVPITGQTFAVLLSSAALGWRRAVPAMALYALAGVAGLPWFAGHSGGLAMLASPLFGYIASYLPAAAAVGLLAGRGHDRHLKGSIPTMVVANLVIYAVGLPWLAVALGTGPLRTLELGFFPFVIGDALKLVAAAALLPGAWCLVGRRRG